MPVKTQATKDHHSHADHSAHAEMMNSADGQNKMAVSATLHCLTGCAIGEVSGLIIGTALGLSAVLTVGLAVSLAFVFGFALSILPLRKVGIPVLTALSLVAAADTLSIATMEVVDNAVMLAIPGAMDAGIVNPLFWVAMPLALAVAFFVALPVNKYLLKRGKGHAITMNALMERGGH